MSQSNVIVGAMLLAFFIFLTVRGELPTYLKIIGLGGK